MTLASGVADDQFGQYMKKAIAVGERLGKSVAFDSAMSTLQLLHDGKVRLHGAGFRGRFTRIMPVLVGGVLPPDLITTVRAARTLGSYAESMIAHPTFETLPMREIHLQIELTPQMQGFTEAPPTDEYLDPDRLVQWSTKHIEGAVVELNHQSAGPHVAIDYTEQPKGEALWVASKPMPDAHGNPYVFYVVRSDDGGAWLSDDNADPQYRWNLDARTLFRLREVS